MVKSFWGAIALPVLVGISLSFLVEQLLQPRPPPFWKRPSATFAIHAGLLLLLFAFELSVFRRPWFATTIVLAFIFFVVMVGNAKFHSLGEPFIFQDFEYFIDALKHPRLYIPFLGWWRALMALVAFGLALYAGMKLESPLLGPVPIVDFVAGASTLVAVGIALLWLGGRKKLAVTFEPETDLQQLGLLASLWRYGEEERARANLPCSYDFTIPAQAAGDALPNLVVVQSESFFDARRLFAGVRPEVLREFDAIKAASACQGQLEVAAWGANTVRTEYAFLSGLEPASLGVHRFNPYRKLARLGVPTLASYLKRLGYHTVCVHPYNAGFYARDKVYPLMGFDEFIDVRSFAGIEKTGPYVGDVVLAEKVCSLLDPTSTQPIFVFVISMENHGPLHLEKVQGDDMERLYSSPPPEGCDDLTIYLRHLGNADRMAGMLRDRLSTLPGSNWLCWFGDHVPIMPKVYGAMGAPDGKTDYLIWGSAGNDDSADKGTTQELKVENLSRLLLQKMGLCSAP